MLPPQLTSKPLPRHATEVVAQLQKNGHRALLVGGCVRDLLLGGSPKDFDVATSAQPQEVKRLFGKVIPTGIAHGTVTVLSHGEHVEVTTFRKEGEYRDGRRPSTVSFDAEIEEDLARRDFTINAMAYDPFAPSLVDPFGGQGDLAKGLIRSVRSAEERFAEDGLRPLRAVRFTAVLGFHLEASTEAAISGALATFRKVSVERIREEFTKLLLSPRPALGLALLHRTGLLAAFLPEALAGDWEKKISAVQAAPTLLEVRLAALLPEEGGEEAVLRLTFPNRVAADVAALARCPLAKAVCAPTDAELRRALARCGIQYADRIISLAAARHGDAATQPLREKMQKVLADNPPLKSSALALKGAEIMSVLGVGPSPTVGEASRFLMEAVLDDPSLNDSEKLAALLRKWAKSRGL